MMLEIRLLLFVINIDNNYDSVGVDILNFDSMRLDYRVNFSHAIITQQHKIHQAVISMYVCVSSDARGKGISARSRICAARVGLQFT